MSALSLQELENTAAAYDELLAPAVLQGLSRSLLRIGGRRLGSDVRLRQQCRQWHACR
jgi:hypothetical protein